MATNKIQFSGINRTVSDYSGSGACEELINLRPTETGLVPVKGFSVKMSEVSYNKVYEHNVGTQVNYIGIKESTNRIYFNLISEEGTLISTLFSVAVADNFSQDSIHIATSGNIITISISDKASGLYANYCFRWSNGTYSPLEADIPTVSPIFTIGTPSLKTENSSEGFYEVSGGTVVPVSSSKISEILSTAYSAIQVKNPTLCFGPVIIAVAFKTKDGDTFWTGKWYAVDPTRAINAASITVLTNPYHFTTGTYFPNTVAVNGSAYIGAYGSIATTVTLAGAEVSVTIPAVSDWNEDTSILKGVEIYASVPQLYTDNGFSKVQPEVSPMGGSSPYYLALPEKERKEMGLGGQLLYLQKSYSLSELSSQQSFTMRFAGNLQMTDKTLEVDPGMIVRTGKMLSYNNRYHFYDSNKRVFLGMPKFSVNGATTYTSYVFVDYESENVKGRFYVGQTDVPSSWSIVTAASLNIRRVIVLFNGGVQYIHEYALNASSAYNYSIDDSGAFAASDSDPSSADVAALMALVSAGITTFIDEDEATAINVSEQYNPFVFRPQHSYLAPAAILDLQPQLAKVADISIGNAPLDVFTARGVYALLQGDGTALYGAMIALSNLVSTGNTAVTDTGTFFFASGSLWAMIGLKAVLVSDALSLGPHKEIRSCSGYQSLANSSENTYDISSYESQPSFEEFTKEATITYNRFRDELIVSNRAYPYSYVLSLKYHQWFKIPLSLRQEVVGSDISIVEDTTEIAVGAKAQVRLYLYGISAGDQIEIELWGNGRTYATIAHDVTAAEASDFDLLRDNFISEWNNSENPNIGGKITMAAETTPAAQASFARFVSLTVTERQEGYTEFNGTAFGANDSAIHFDFLRPYSIVDFSDEIESGNTTVHLQSRPLSYDYQYAHIHRIVDMVRTTLTYGQNNITVSLYGSDDLHTWKLLTYASRKSSDAQLPLHISQLRTPSSARSWRYYTIVLGGIIPIDTDFGPLLVDAQPVVRRIG